MLKSLLLCIALVCLFACASRNTANAPVRSTVSPGLPVLHSPPDAQSAEALVRYIAAVSQLNHEQRDTLQRDDLRHYRSAPNALDALVLAISLSAPPANAKAHDIVAAAFDIDPPLPATLQVVARRAASLGETIDELEAAAHRHRTRSESLEQTLASEREVAARELEKLKAQLKHAQAKINALTTIEEEIRRTEPTGKDSP